MAIYTISLDFLEKLERRDLLYIGSILYALSDPDYCNRIAVDKDHKILDFYNNTKSELKDFIIPWCEYISKLSSPIFEPTNADISDLTDSYNICHEICKAINGSRNLIIHTYSTYPRSLSDDHSFIYDDECEIHVLDKDDAKKDIKRNQSHEERQTGKRLIEQLKRCPKGQKGWKQYEDIGTEIFSFLFKSSFRNYTSEYQSLTADHKQRRDLVIYNTYKDATSFWQRVKNDYNSNIIIIDFKNYNQTLNPDEFYTPTKYLNSIAGYFVIVLSRLGLDEAAQAFQLKLLSEKNELVLCLTDDDLISMINQKMEGQDPLNSLEEKYFTLCKSK